MSYKASKQLDTYYNEFNDYENFKIRSKYKNHNKDNIKITTKKLPADFFRPLTRQTIDFQSYHENKLNGMKTPCFGQQKPQSHSVSLIPKNKQNFDEFVNRIETLPTEKPSNNYQNHPKRNLSRDLYKKQQQYSYRMRCREPAVQISHQSTQRRRLKYQKKLTLNDEIQIGKNKNKNICENRIRLNVKKFFKEQTLENKVQNNETNRKWKNTNKLPPLL